MKEAGSGKVVFQQTIDLSGIKDGKLTNFDFPKIVGAKGKKYELTIKGSGFKKEHLLLSGKALGTITNKVS